jgi:hypothetical protein
VQNFSKALESASVRASALVFGILDAVVSVPILEIVSGAFGAFTDFTFDMWRGVIGLAYDVLLRFVFIGPMQLLMRRWNLLRRALALTAFVVIPCAVGIVYSFRWNAFPWLLLALSVCLTLTAASFSEGSGS